MFKRKVQNEMVKTHNFPQKIIKAGSLLLGKNSYIKHEISKHSKNLKARERE